MRHYELTFLTPVETSEQELKSIQEKITSFIQKEGGYLIDFQKPIKKPIFFADRKKNQGLLISLYFQLMAEKIDELRKNLKGENKILRFIIINKKTPKKIPLPQKTEKITQAPQKTKVEMGEIEKKLEEILGT